MLNDDRLLGEATIRLLRAGQAQAPSTATRHGRLPWRLGRCGRPAARSGGSLSGQRVCPSVLVGETLEDAVDGFHELAPTGVP